jgi:formylglycine-generating enzyme required for sulfatase activity/tRNA A-37 threonylcarbamoyl transferase component Bud32
MDPNPEKTVFSPRPASKGDQFQPGEVVGQYRVERVLGAGGMGVVYLVSHTALKKHFALKALPVVLAQETSFVARFKREAEMLARLKHAHIVNVTDFGESQGRLYLVLEYVDGGTFEEWFEKNRKPGGGAPAAEVQRLVGQVLDGLAHAHQAGIVHRDLKPANVLLEKTGEAKISDFGLARVVAEEEYRRTGGTASPFHGDSVTTTGAIVGTIDFMSPEARNMRPSDLRSDIYAVGVITYYLLTGRKPHGIAQLASRLVPGLDPRWDKFIATCLAEDPTQRYQTATAALEHLKTIHSSNGKNRWLLPAALVAGLAIAGAGWWFMSRPAEVKVVNRPVESAHDATATAATLAPDTKAEAPKAVETPNTTHRRFTLTGLPAGAVAVYHLRNFPVGSDGRVTLDLAAGPQTVQVTAPGYDDWVGEVGAGEAETEGTVPIKQIPPHAVRITGLPPQAQLKIGDRTVTVDASGAALFELRPGQQAVSATAPKYLPLESSVEILASTQTVALEMKRVPPPAEVLVKLAGGVEVKFKWIPPGEFYFGSPPDERGRQHSDLPREKRTIAQGFYMAETEMTQRQHRALTGKNPSTSRTLGDENRPVEQVGWRDLETGGGALEKINDVLRRLELPYKAELPTEVEWEYACRAGTETGFNDGSQLTSERDDPALNALAFYSRGGARTAPSPVAKFKPNAWGLYDMLGNVAEWTLSGRESRERVLVLRGGSWKASPAYCRSASRVELTPETRPTEIMGYRLLLRSTEN